MNIENIESKGKYLEEDSRDKLSKHGNVSQKRAYLQRMLDWNAIKKYAELRKIKVELQ